MSKGILIAIVVLALLIFVVTNAEAAPVQPLPGGSNLDTLSAGAQVFASAIAFAEGFGVAGKTPTTHNNPGDLTDGQGNVRSFGSVVDGQNALASQVSAMLAGIAPYSQLASIADTANTYVGTSDAANWASNVVYYFRNNGYPDVSTDTTLGQIANL